MSQKYIISRDQAEVTLKMPNGHVWNVTWTYNGTNWVPVDFHRI